MAPVNTNRRGRRTLMAEINVVPYIDVMLVLLIIFMVTAPLLTQGIKVELPKAGAEPLPEDLLRDHQPLVLSIDKQGRYFINIGKDNEKPAEERVIVDRVATVLRREPKTPVLVKADQSVAYGRVVTGMVILQRAGATQIGFITDPLEPVPVLKN
jgi:biopolymer transport protein TolR